MRRSVRGLSVKSKDKAGKPLPYDACGAHMTKGHDSAKRLWNQLDKSKRARFPDV